MPRTRKRKPDYRKTSGGAGRGGKFPENKRKLAGPSTPLHPYLETLRSGFEQTAPDNYIGWVDDGLTIYQDTLTPKEFAEHALRTLERQLPESRVFDLLAEGGVRIVMDHPNAPSRLDGKADGHWDRIANAVVLRDIANGSTIRHEVGHAAHDTYAFRSRANPNATPLHATPEFRAAVASDLSSAPSRTSTEFLKRNDYYTGTGTHATSGLYRDQFKEMYAETWACMSTPLRSAHWPRIEQWKEAFPETWKIVEKDYINLIFKK